VSIAGSTPFLYAPAAALGLNITGALDDLDALALLDDGALNPGTGMPYFDPSVDRILYSVRRGSAVLGAPDSAFGAAIQEGDVLAPPTVSGGFPSIFIAAEALALTTLRTTPGGRADDLDALDVVPEPSSLALVVLGFVCLAARRRKRQR
jgi:hypothetical protein